MIEYVTVWVDDLPDLKRGEEIVRCSDCVWSKPDQSDHEHRELHCNMWIADVSAEGFCSRGKRNDGFTPKNDISGTEVDADDADAASVSVSRFIEAGNETGSADSREKLEADVRNVLSQWMFETGWTGNTAHGLHESVVMRWLDRQAAITERECREYEDALREQHHKRIAELKAKLDAEAQHAREAWQLWGEADARAEQAETERDELQREIATLKEHRAANMEKLHELTDECAELRKYRDEWKGLAEKYRTDSIAAQAETERYWAKLGDVLDALHEAERAAR